jgi:hypothetical protein
MEASMNKLSAASKFSHNKPGDSDYKVPPVTPWK